MDKEAIREELKKVRKEIKDLRSKFLEKKDQKEGHFEEGEKYSKEIDDLYEEVKKIEQENNLDKINEELEERKSEHAEFKSKLDDLEAKFDSAKKNSKTKKRPAIKTISLEKAKAELKKLDLKLQTQVLSLDKESELTKKIGELKDMITRHEGGTPGMSAEMKKIKKELNAFRRKYYSAEKRIRSLYKQIRLISKEKKVRYKKIDELRSLKKEAFDGFRSQKKNYVDLGKVLKDLFKREEDLLSQLGESPVQKKRQLEKNIKAKQKEVEDKLMKKGVLTTEDLLMLQSKN